MELTDFIFFNPKSAFRNPQLKLVGARGFEPPAFCSQSRRATGLRHAPRGNATKTSGSAPAYNTQQAIHCQAHNYYAYLAPSERYALPAAPVHAFILFP